MARQGYLILDSDLHMMEPDDLGPAISTSHTGGTPRVSSQQLPENSEDKGNADVIEGIELQGLAIPAHGKLPGAAASRRELRRRSRAGHPHSKVARARGFDPVSTLTAMDIEGIGVAVMYGPRAGRSCVTTTWRRITLRHSPAPTTTGPTISARAIRGASNSQHKLRCTMYRRRWPRHIAVLPNSALSQSSARPIP